MSQYVDPIIDDVQRNVGTLSSTVVDPVDMRATEKVVISIYNESLTDTFDGDIEVSATGAAPWTVLADDTFAVLGPSVGRFAFVDAAYQWVRVVGNFGVGNDTVRINVVSQRANGAH